MAAILTGMATPSTPAPPPRREGRRFPIPTPADLRHPRQRPDEPPEEPPDERSGPPEAPDPDHSPDRGSLGTDPPVGAEAQAGAAGSDQTTGAGPTPGRSAGRSDPATPTPATLPRPRRSRDQPPPEQPEQAPSRRLFPNPATLMAAGRGRKGRSGGLRHRRLPKVEETSAGGVVLDLTSTPPGVALIARHDRRSRLLWSLPKGHVEAGETPEQAALREVHEETGLVGRILAPLGIIDFWFVVEDRRIHKTVHHYVIEAIGGDLCDDDLEVEAVAWIPYDQVVRKLAYGDERRLVEKVAQIVPGVR